MFFLNLRFHSESVLSVKTIGVRDDHSYATSDTTLTADHGGVDTPATVSASFSSMACPNPGKKTKLIVYKLRCELFEIWACFSPVGSIKHFYD